MCLAKLSNQTKTQWSKLQRSSAEMGNSAKRMTLSVALCQSCLYGSVVRQKSLWEKVSLRRLRHKIELFRQKSNYCGLQTTRHCSLPVNTIPTVKHGGDSNILWECLSAAETARLVRMTQSIQLRKYWSGFGTSLWLKTPISHLWKDLMIAVHRCFPPTQEKWDKLPKCRDLPKKTWSCNYCQGRLCWM